MTAEPPCPPAVGDQGSSPAETRPLRAVRRRFDAIDRETWDALAAANPWATPFSAWAVHRAWWDAYGSNAHEETLAIVPADSADDAAPVAIAPLMHRHEVEPSDLELHTTIRHTEGESLTAGAARRHRDVLRCELPRRLRHAACGSRRSARRRRRGRRLLRGDQRAAGPTRAGTWWTCAACGAPIPRPMRWPRRSGGVRRRTAGRWRSSRRTCVPVVSLPRGGTIDDVLGALGKKERHEIRRKVRRAEAAGEVRLETSRDPIDDLPAFIDLHQRRWGAEGLFPDTPGGAQSRTFLRRLFELQGADGPFRLSFLTVGERRIAAGLTVETDDTLMYYNAGIDPDARDLSPGVVMIERYLRRALEQGMTRMDFLRGNEPYKYEWGAADERIGRILVRRGAEATAGEARDR